MGSKKISIIVPCYNVQEYIDRCVESIINQTIGIKNLEIILVNDASTDNTLKKLAEWENRYPDNILVISYDENLRQGGARNIGLSQATGDYIGFVDSDDWIDTHMYEEMFKVVESSQCDVVRCQFCRDSSTGELSAPEWGLIMTGLYSRSLIYDNDVYFPEKVAYEDNYWGPLLRKYVKTEEKINKTFYHYFVNPNSTVTGRNQTHQLDRLITEVMLLEAYQERGFWDGNEGVIFIDFIQRYYLNTWFIIFVRFDDIPDILNVMIDTVSFFFPDYKERLAKMSFTYRSQLLIDMLVNPEENDIISIKIKWVKNWLEDQDIVF